LHLPLRGALHFAVASLHFRLRCSYLYSFVVTLLLPLIPFSIGLVFTGVAWVWSLTVARRSVLWIHFRFMCVDSADVKRYFLEWLSISAPFLTGVYNCLCTKTFDTFICFQLADMETYVLTVAPEITCWETRTHQTMLALSALSLVIYVLGIPLFVFYTMSYAYKYDKLRDPKWLKVLGFLYSRYGKRAD
jgi:hypothetical protein